MFSLVIKIIKINTSKGILNLIAVPFICGQYRKAIVVILTYLSWFIGQSKQMKSFRPVWISSRRLVVVVPQIGARSLWYDIPRIAKYEGGQHISHLNKWNSCRQTWSYLRQIHNQLKLIMFFWDQWIYNLISSELVVKTPLKMFTWNWSSLKWVNNFL